WIADFARTLPFFAEAMALWRTLPEALGVDLELRCPGGIMVAETERQLATLEAKVALERANGLRIEMVAPPALRELAPYLPERILGASYCPDEGMANALLAVTALAAAARAAGARFVTNARVGAMTAHASGWCVATGRGAIESRRVVIAAGSASA